MPLLILLLIWAVYAPSVRLMLIHDDVVNAAWMSFRNPLTAFFPAFTLGAPSIGGAEGRPVANLLWIVTRELFGSFVPSITHAWNAWLHVLNVALVMALARRLAHRLGFRSAVFEWTTGAIFGLFPLSYQAVIWAGALYHPVMAACGLGAIHASLTNKLRPLTRYALTLLLLLAATLSQESGFVFGAIVVVIQFVLALGHWRRLNKAALLAGASVFAYPIAFRLARFYLQNTSQPRNVAGEFVLNMGIFAQTFVAWLVVVLRRWIGIPEDPHFIIWLMFAAVIVLGLIGLWRMRLGRLGLIAVLVWCVSVVPPALALDEAYVRFGPRLSYVPSISVALFWGALTAGVWQALRRLPGSSVWRIAFAVVLLPLFAWCVPYIQFRMRETERLTPAMQLIDRAMQQTEVDRGVLLINMPWWNAPTYPEFWIGAEGMPIFQDGGPARLWLDLVSGHDYQHVDFVRHPISFVQGPDWTYGAPGEEVDDAGLRQRILQYNLAFRFMYDAPGLRAEWVSRIEPSQPVSNAFATLQPQSENTSARVQIQSAQAVRCGDVIQMALTWQVDTALTRPTAVFVHGHDAQGQQVLVADLDLMRGYMPLNELPAGIRMTERREIPVPANTNVTEIRLGAFDRETGQRLLAQQSTGAPWPGDEVYVPIVAGCL